MENENNLTDMSYYEVSVQRFAVVQVPATAVKDAKEAFDLVSRGDFPEDWVSEDELDCGFWMPLGTADEVQLVDNDNIPF